ncbi:MAG: DMT family transporter [Chlamydiia bacterium]|nr:DMT family transporter [Chlamydiia bacterium]
MIQADQRPQKRLGLGIFTVILATVALAIQAMFVKLASPDLSTNFICFSRTAVNFILLIGWILISPKTEKGKELYQTKRFGHHLIRSLAGVAAIYCFYYSITLLTLATGTLIYYSFPLFVPLISRVWLKITILKRLWWGLSVAFLGLLIVLHPGKELFDPLVLIPLLGAIVAAIAVIAMRILNYTEPWERITLYYFAIGVIVATIVLLLFPDPNAVYTPRSLTYAVLAGVFGAIFQVALTFSAKFAPMRLISPFIYLSFIFGAVIQYIIWGQAVKMGEVIGFILIVAGTILLVFLYPKDDLQFHLKKEKKS